MSYNARHGIIRYLFTLPIIILAGYVVNVVFGYFGITPELQDVVQWVLDEKSPLILGCLLFLVLL